MKPDQNRRKANIENPKHLILSLVLKEDVVVAAVMMVRILSTVMNVHQHKSATDVQLQGKVKTKRTLSR